MSATEQAAEAARAAGKNISGDGVRQLGVVDATATAAVSTSPIDPNLREQARALLREEVERMTQARAAHSLEQQNGAPARGSGRLDAMAASLEGATRFALRIGLLSPGEAREIWTAARVAGVHDVPPTTTEGTR